MKKITILTALLTLMFFFSNITGAESKTDPKNCYKIRLTCKINRINAPIIAYALFNEDPLKIFKNNVYHLREYFEKSIENETKQGKAKIFISSCLMGAWDNMFKLVSGDKIQLITNKGGIAGLGSDIPQGMEKTIYLATKSFVGYGQDLIVWYFPLKVKAGDNIDLVLTDENMFNYQSLPELNYIDFSLMKK